MIWAKKYKIFRMIFSSDCSWDDVMYLNNRFKAAYRTFPAIKLVYMGISSLCDDPALDIVHYAIQSHPPPNDHENIFVSLRLFMCIDGGSMVSVDFF